MTLRRAVIALVTAAVAALFALPGTAFAHAELLQSNPSAGSVLDAAPASITLTFSEPVEVSLGAIRLFDGSGRAVAIGASRHPQGKDAAVTVELGALRNGSYVVDWRVVSADSHPVQGAYTFQVGPSADLQPGILDGIVSKDSTNHAASAALAVLRGLIIASIALVFGGLVALAWGMVDDYRRIRMAIVAAAVTSAVAGLLQLPLEFSYATGRSLSAIGDASAWSDTFDSRVGTAWVVRSMITAVVGAALLITRADRTRWWWRAGLVLGVLATGAASAYGGHGATGRWIPVGVLATAVHVAGMAVWLGGLVALVLCLGTLGAAGLRRFSAVALAMIALVVASGVVQGVRQLGSFDALTSTSYGTALIWKSMFVVVLLMIATVSRRIAHRTEIDHQRLRRMLLVETVLAVAIVTATSLLMASNPSTAAAPKPFSATLVDGDRLASITLEPGRTGANELHIYLSSAASSLIEPDAVTVEISDPSRDVAAIQIPVTRSAASHFTTSNATFPYATTWTLVVTVRYGFDEVQFTAHVPIR
jgi:copper transport protein